MESKYRSHEEGLAPLQRKVKLSGDWVSQYAAERGADVNSVRTTIATLERSHELLWAIRYKRVATASQCTENQGVDLAAAVYAIC